ncbi:MAG: IS1634 family transposase [Candidatus Atribacteria bacterium]|nr:IS1634 family transposase [Candidatus Atribacteria bacterium]
MFIRPCYRRKDGKRHAYWALMESYRTERGPRQRVVAYLGQLDEPHRLGVKEAAEGKQGPHQKRLFDDVRPQWVEVDVKRLRVENRKDFGGPWLGLELVDQLGLKEFLDRTIPTGREEVLWSLMALVLVLCRLCDPSSDLHIAEHFYAQSALPDLLGVPSEKINEQRLYRALDALLPHKEALEVFLKNRLGDLFGLEYDLLLYDVTSTYFEGQAEANPSAKRGYSRDHRPDCKQVCIGLVVSKCGMPLGYEVFAGNRTDVTTLQEIVQTMERRYGRADRIWVGDRGMVSADNIAFLKQSGRRYIVGTPKSMLKQFERELLSEDWRTIRDGLEVKLCPSPDGAETFVLCRSRDRRKKEKAMHGHFEQRIEEGLRRIEASCHKQRLQPLIVAQRLGRLLGQNSRAAGLFETEVRTAADGRASLHWKKIETWRDWAALSEGCYLLRSNVVEWSDEELWKAYIQLTEAEAAFRIHKSDLRLRPIWHQKEERVLAHILVCFLAYVLWKTLSQRCQRAGLGHEPRRVFEELGKIQLVDVVLPTRQGTEIRRRCVTQPTDHQTILLTRLQFRLPAIRLTEGV